MDIPFDILDHIFSFLITHPASLVACSEAHPVFSRMVEKYQYHCLTIDPQSSGLITKLLLDKPRIANYVRVLRIEGELHGPFYSIRKSYFDSIAAILPLFPVLKCIVLSYGGMMTWNTDMPQAFRKALEDCLCLPTLREFHVDRYIEKFPVSMIDSHANIDCFSLCGTPELSGVADITYPQLKSLSVTGFYDQNHHISFGAWAKPRITRLQLLKYDYSSDDTLLELLEICSDTLTTLDLTLGSDVDSQYSTTSFFNSTVIQNVPLSIHLPSNLQNLTIRALIRFYCHGSEDPYERYESFLSAAIEIFKIAPSLHRITLEINVDLTDADHAMFDDVDLSPLTGLADSPGSFSRIDLHFNFEWDFTRTKLVSLLANIGGLAELMEQGVLVVHLNEDAPISGSPDEAVDG